jgi:hypothetical protein
VEYDVHGWMRVVIVRVVDNGCTVKSEVIFSFSKFQLYLLLLLYGNLHGPEYLYTLPRLRVLCTPQHDPPGQPDEVLCTRPVECDVKGQISIVNVITSNNGCTEIRTVAVPEVMF